MYEQVLLACLEVQDLTGAEVCLQALETKFGLESKRVAKLRVQYYMALGDRTQAEDLISTLLDLDPSDQFLLKRRITIKRELGRMLEAIDLLNEYLQVFMADTEAWQELAELYLSLQSYKNAAFCYEELIAAYPQVHHYYVKYAEILYTLGGDINLELARKYFAFSLELTAENNTRGFYGLLMTTHALGSATKKAAQSLKLNGDLNRLAQDKLREIYARQDLSALPFYHSTLDSLKKLTPTLESTSETSATSSKTKA